MLGKQCVEFLIDFGSPVTKIQFVVWKRLRSDVGHASERNATCKKKRAQSGRYSSFRKGLEPRFSSLPFKIIEKLGETVKIQNVKGTVYSRCTDQVKKCSMS